MYIDLPTTIKKKKTTYIVVGVLLKVVDIRLLKVVAPSTDNSNSWCQVASLIAFII